jgi:hypothetical protein
MKGKRPDGSISSGIYDTVEKLTADGKMTRTAAFRRIAKESGRKEGTVAVNYYYMARKRGAKLRRRGRPKTVASARRNGKPSKIGSALKSLTELIRAQETELAGLRRENERFAEIKKLMGRA